MSRSLLMVGRLLVLLALVIGGLFAATPYPLPAQATPSTESPTGRWIVRLHAPPLAQAPLTRPEFAALALPRTASGRLDANSAAALQYRQSLQQQQLATFRAIQQIVPAAQLQRQYQVVLNGIALDLSQTSTMELARIRSLPEVAAVYPDQPHELHLSSSNDLIRATELWSDPVIGGVENAGEGIKIAIIDSGIMLDNPFFNPTGYSYPEATHAARAPSPRPR
ncbi:MAG: hypothetical protein HC893_00125 [Chloroflexaceae bacterium]|nr:hypothetical protein [Chloroflexaceae bacterium]